MGGELEAVKLERPTDWQTAKNLYDITEPVIPHRVYEEALPLQGNRWYT